MAMTKTDPKLLKARDWEARDAAEAEAWARAARDPEFVQENEEIAAAFAWADSEAWQQE